MTRNSTSDAVNVLPNAVQVISQVAGAGSSQRREIHVKIRLPKQELSKLEIEDVVEDDDDDEDSILRSSHIIPTLPTTFEYESEDPFSSEGDEFLLDAELDKAIKSVFGDTPASDTSSPSTKDHPRITTRKPDFQKESTPLRSSQRLREKIQKQEKFERQIVKESVVVHKDQHQVKIVDGYKPVPKHILPMIEQEIGAMNDEFAIVDKFIFSLKDPLGASKIKLPVKSMYCIHFECFDFNNFCLFNKIPPGVKLLVKKDLAKKSFESIKLRKRVHKEVKSEYVTIISDPKAYTAKFIAPMGPIYKCPICDRSFPLSELVMGDAYNYFVKSTPVDAERVELLDMNRYKVLDDKRIPKAVEEEIIVLSDDDDDNNNGIVNANYDDKVNANQADTVGLASLQNLSYDSGDDLFDDGLDEEILNLSESDYQRFGQGSSYDDPVTID
ncbi:zinc finger protein, MIZ type [Scheffersomyces stipitis CBS 6054]|uniref:Zinc finger protein, MIZ type n=1 Tax=Scheffersomyces stipitis (strain ATCC 58785 / CBS 6054 / NBRC 10063 / NRRL Y-11545) TaxID=322104 RepID=A3LYQ5_PICST|nr:zinc finger protein, MIZ type [Scheffersomyces stipitis CBS 6054]ABN68016.2 zinc finger protein, MIZ type [Scheffersomyces stipitis CBS 6054]